MTLQTPAREKPRWPLADAQAVAEQLKLQLEHACQRIEIAGSIRRKSLRIGDVELLVIPKPAENGFYTDAVDEAVHQLMEDGELVLRPNIKGGTSYGPKNKYLVHVPSGIPVDLFSTEAQYWGMALFVRTGPAAYNVKAMARFKSVGFQGHAYGGVTNRRGEEMACPEEADVYRLLRWVWVPPEARV